MVIVVKVKGDVEHRDELIGSVPLVVVDISGSSSPLASSNGGELGGDVVGEAGVHGDVQLPAVSCEQRGKQDHKVSKKNFPGSSDMYHRVSSVVSARMSLVCCAYRGTWFL